MIEMLRVTLQAAVVIAMNFLGSGGESHVVDDAKAETRLVTFRMQLRFDDLRDAKGLRVTRLLPRTIPRRQTVRWLRFSHPARIIDKDGERYVEFMFDELDQATTLEVSGLIELHRYDLTRARRHDDPPSPEARGLDEFLRAERFIEKDDKEIQRVVRKLIRPKQSATIRALHKYVVSRLTYDGYQPKDIGARTALRKRKGDCTEFADLLVALCRAAKIPARQVEGYMTTWRGTPQHNWVEIHTSDHGWVPFDPMRVDQRQARYDRLPNEYIYLGVTRNNEALSGHHYWAYTLKSGNVQANDRLTVEREPMPKKK